MAIMLLLPSVEYVMTFYGLDRDFDLDFEMQVRSSADGASLFAFKETRNK